MDLPDLVQRVPSGAFVTLPCVHYGCAQTANYYRFADPQVHARQLEFVVLAGSRRPMAHSLPRVIAESVAKDHVVCTLHDDERTRLSAAGATMHALERGETTVRGVEVSRLPVWCSRPRVGAEIAGEVPPHRR